MVKQVIVWRKDLNCRLGKKMAQCAHASMKVFFDRMKNVGSNIYHFKEFEITFTMEMIVWMDSSFTKIVVGCNSEQELFDLKRQADEANIVNAIILDNGNTEFKEKCPVCKGEIKLVGPNKVKQYCPYCDGTGKVNKPTYTCLAIGPDEEEKIDRITGNLKLL